MKRSEIKIGGVYSNGKKGKREVLEFPTTYAQVADNVRYKILSSRYKAEIGEVYTVTVPSFAAWAKEKVS